jgi:hypothetical protein
MGTIKETTKKILSIPAQISQQHPHAARNIKITALAGAILFSLLLLFTSGVGGFSLLGAHCSYFAALNTAITSVWKGLPYLMVALGGPGLLIALGLMIYGVYKLIKKILEKTEQDQEPVYEYSGLGHSPAPFINGMRSSEDFIDKNHFYVIEGNTLVRKEDETQKYFVYTYSRQQVNGMADEYFNDEMAKTMSKDNIVFIFYDPNGEENEEAYTSYETEGGKLFAYSWRSLEECVVLLDKNVNILTDANEFHALLPNK